MTLTVHDSRIIRLMNHNSPASNSIRARISAEESDEHQITTSKLRTEIKAATAELRWLSNTHATRTISVSDS